MSAGDVFSVFVDAPTKDGKGKVLPPSALKKRFLSANVERASHWTLRAKIAEAWRKATVKAVEDQLPGLKLEKVRVECHFVKGNSANYDPGNLSPVMKAIVDGLVEAVVIVDDDHSRLVGPDPRHGGNDTQRPGVWVRIVDMEGVRHD